ncbi:hypothetical protein [Candidatus Formimonas warabiya]|nr:hypothetical protein [Candidatus Formimonas warabiya]
MAKSEDCDQLLLYVITYIIFFRLSTGIAVQPEFRAPTVIVS